MRRALEMASYVAMIAAAGVVVWRLGFPPGPPEPPLAVQDVAFTLAAEDIRHVEGDGPIALVEFTDLECPFCQRFKAETYPQIKAQFIDTGQVRYITLHFPLDIHPNARQMALEKSGESEERIDADLALGRGIGVSATPTFFVGVVQHDGSIALDRRIIGAHPVEVFTGELHAAQNRSQP